MVASENKHIEYLDTLSHYWAIIFKRRWFLFIFVTISGIGAIVLSLMMTKFYLAETVILPSTDAPSELQRLAAFAGFSSEHISTPSQLYPEILGSRMLQKRILQRKYHSVFFDSSVTLIDYWFSEEQYLSQAEKMTEALRRLRNDVVNVFQDKRNNLLTISVITKEPQLSADIANVMVEELEVYNRDYRKIKAREQRQFIEERLNSVKADLTDAEDHIRLFSEKNRRVMDSPSLLLERERLMREVELNNALYAELRKQYELIKIEEIKNTPVIDVLDKAEPPTQRCRPKRTNTVIIITFIMTILGILIVFAEHYYNMLAKRRK